MDNQAYIEEAAEKLRNSLAIIRENNRQLGISQKQEQEQKTGTQPGQMSPSDALDAYNKYKQFSGSGNELGSAQFQGPQSSAGQGLQGGGQMTASGHPGMGVGQTGQLGASQFQGTQLSSGQGMMSGGGQTANGVSGQTAGTGGGSGVTTMGWIAAAIVAQHQMSNETDTKIKMGDGSEVETDDAFSGHYATEPWLAFASDKLGTTPTRGEKFDAAMENGGGKEGWETAPGAIGYWANPGGEWSEKSGEALLGTDKYNKYINPAGKLEDETGRLLGKWFG